MTARHDSTGCWGLGRDSRPNPQQSHPGWLVSGNRRGVIGQICDDMRMPVDLPKSLTGLLPLQANVVSREQALTRGKSRHDVAGLLKSGRWQRLHRGVYYTIPGPVPRTAELWGPVLPLRHG